jgi:CheY-like chemotaxis protein
MDMSVYNILVVEDDEVDRMNIQRSFKKVNIVNPLHFAEDGIVALEKLASGEIKKPLIILLDIKMPRMNGLEFLTVLRQDEKWKGVPVVILTTSADEKDKVEAYSLNVAGYVLKPVEFEGFLAAVAAIGSYWSMCEFPIATVE